MHMLSIPVGRLPKLALEVESVILSKSMRGFQTNLLSWLRIEVCKASLAELHKAVGMRGVVHVNAQYLRVGSSPDIFTLASRRA
jgi:hypothetical protein